MRFWLKMAATLACMLAATAALGRPVLLEVTADSGQIGQGIDIRFSEPVEYRFFNLSQPERLVIDLPVMDWALPPAHVEQVVRRIESIDAVRHGSFRPCTYRIVFDLKHPIAIADATVVPDRSAYRLRIAWTSAHLFRPQKFGQHRVVPLPRPRPDVSEPYQPPLIAIDPGHGGQDPGTIGPGGSREKHITLRAAKLLADRLQGTGQYRVLLTRRDDRFLRLRDRTTIARRAKADLFLSLHADSAPSNDARGLSVYTLSSQASDQEAAALARRENMADVLGGVDLTDEPDQVVSILIDLAQRETRNRSVRVANHVVTAMVGRVDLLSRPHRQAGFAVLKAPDVPAVLIELGFLSHRAEEKLLHSSAHLSRIVDGIVTAIDQYFDTLARISG